MSSGVFRARGSRQLRASLRGSLLAHEGGITVGQSLGESSVLNDAGGAPGLKVENMPGVTTDASGHAVVPLASAFRENRIALNVNSAGEDTDVKATFSTRCGLRMLVTLTRCGKHVPFGNMVTLKGQEQRKPVRA